MLSRNKMIPVLVLVMAMTPLIAGVSGAGEGLTTTKSEIKANVPISFDATGLTVSTYYTLYVETTMKGNKSTSSTLTVLEFKFTVSDTYVGTWVTVALKNSSGGATLASYEIEVVDVVPQYTIDMIGGFIPLIMVFAVVFGMIGGLVITVRKIIT